MLPLPLLLLSRSGYHSIKSFDQTFHLEKRWKLVREMGSGAYGVVMSVRHPHHFFFLLLSFHVCLFQLPISSARLRMRSRARRSRSRWSRVYLQRRRWRNARCASSLSFDTSATTRTSPGLSTSMASRRVSMKCELCRRAALNVLLSRWFTAGIFSWRYGYPSNTRRPDSEHFWYSPWKVCSPSTIIPDVALNPSIPRAADLHQIIKSGQALTNEHVQYFTYQILRGIIHSLGLPVSRHSIPIRA